MKTLPQTIALLLVLLVAGCRTKYVENWFVRNDALMEAINAGDRECVTDLLTENPWLLDEGWHHDPDYDFIHAAAQTGDVEMVKILLGKKPDLLNQEEKWVGTPLDFSEFYEHGDLRTYLLLKGAKNRPAVDLAD